MPSEITVSPITSPLPRDELGKFLPNPRSVRAFEGIQTDVVQTIPDAIRQIIDLTNSLLAAPYITWAETPTLENERTLAVTSTLQLTNTGSQVILGLAETGFAAGFYGSETQTVGVRVDLYGRVTGVEVYDLVSDNVAEGVSNLYFTDERARGALSGGRGIDYAPETGEIAIDGDAASSGTYTPTLTPVSNVAALTAYSAQWLLVFGVVTVSLRLDVTATAAGSVTQVGISLPIPSAFTSAEQCSGAASAVSIQQAGGILADPANDRASLQFVATDTSVRGMFCTFQYRVL